MEVKATGSYDACDKPNNKSMSLMARSDYGQIRICIFGGSTQMYLTKEKAQEFAKELLAMVK